MSQENTITERIQKIEKGITDSKNFRRDAQTQGDIYGKQLAENTQKLIELGTTPEKAEVDIINISKEIELLTSKIEQMIPFEELERREQRNSAKQN